MKQVRYDDGHARHIVILAYNSLDYNRLLAELPSANDMPKDGYVANYIAYLCKPTTAIPHVPAIIKCCHYCTRDDALYLREAHYTRRQHDSD